MTQKERKENLEQMFGEIERPYRPDVRWWLAEGLHTDPTLRRNVKEIYDSGFGAAEFLAMPEPGADSSIYGWGSEEWTSDSRLIIQEATERGLGFSLTSGSHWATANLPDTYVWQGRPYNPDHKAASKELDYATILLQPGECFEGKIPYPVHIEAVAGDIHGSAATYTEHVFQGVVAAKLIKAREGAGQDYAYREGSGTGALDASTLVDLTDQVRQEDGAYVLRYQAPEDGQYALFCYFMHGTGQTASPSVSTNYTINYMDRYGVEALIDYWEEVVLTEDLKAMIRKNGRGEIYMDSLELLTYGAGGIFWGYHLKEEFQRRKGYDITKYLPLVTMDNARVTSRRPKVYDYTAPGAEDLVRRVRTDYAHVISCLYVENLLGPLADWLHSLHMTLRAEPSYGVNFEISLPAAVVDGIETESFAQTAEVDLYRGESGSANMYGRLFSSETGAVHGHNYYYNMDTWTQLCNLQFAEGINRTVFHGYSAIEGSEDSTRWPGHEGMYPKFSERFSSRQPASLHYPQWTRMLGRVQKAMRQGTAVRDLAILRTDYAFINYGNPEAYKTFETNYMMHDMAYFWKDLSLQQAGYTYDYFSPMLLEDTDHVRWTGEALQPDGPAYKAVLLYQDTLEPDSARQILELARAGLPVLFVNHTRETVTYEGPENVYEKAASKSPYLMQTDTELAQIVTDIKALPNVRELDTPKDVLDTLRQMGVHPRAGFEEANNRILTSSRWDREKGMFYTFVYSYKFAVEKDAPALSFTLRLEGEGVPYRINVWNGQVEPIGTYQVQEGYTCVPLTLSSGEACLIALDLTEKEALYAVASTWDAIRLQEGYAYGMAFQSGEYTAAWSDGQETKTALAVPEPTVLRHWDVEIEDWDEGEKQVLTEEKFGHVTREVYYTSRKTVLTFSDAPLVPWKDLPASAEQLEQLSGEHPDMSQVSGIGRYRTTYTWDAEESLGAYLQLSFAGGGTVKVRVNGEEAAFLDTRTLRADISAYLHAGANEIELEVTTTLTNRMLARGYQAQNSAWTDTFPTVQAYGVIGDVWIKPYRQQPLRPISS